MSREDVLMRGHGAWTTLGIISAILVFLLALGMFGDHFGFTVKGVPYGSMAEANWSDEWMENDYWTEGLTQDYYEELLYRHATKNQLVGAIQYLYYMGTFQIDGMPYWCTGIFYFVTILALFLAYILIRSGGN